MRGYPLLIITFIFVFYNEVIHGLPFHTRSRSIHKPLFRDSCSYTCNDLASLLALSRTLDEMEEPEKEVATAPSLFNADELIMKLVNALIYATTHRIENHCHCSHSVASASDDSRHGGVVPSGNAVNAHSSNGLLNLDLLNSNKRDNLLDLDLSNQHLVGVGLGGRNQDESSSATSRAYSSIYSNDPTISTSRTSSGTSSDSVVNVALIDSKNPNNIAAVNLERQNVVGVGLLGEANGNGRQGNTGEGLVNLHVLKANKDNNVAELAVAKQNVLGVGVGGSNDGLLNNITN